MQLFLAKRLAPKPPRKGPRDLSKKCVRDVHHKVEAKLTATLKVSDMSPDAASNDMVILFETCE